VFGRSPKIFVGPRSWSLSTTEGSTARRKLKIASGSGNSTEIDLSGCRRANLEFFGNRRRDCPWCWCTSRWKRLHDAASRVAGLVGNRLRRIDSFLLTCACRSRRMERGNNKFSIVTTLNISPKKKRRRSRYHSEPAWAKSYLLYPLTCLILPIAYLPHPATFFDESSS